MRLANADLSEEESDEEETWVRGYRISIVYEYNIINSIQLNPINYLMSNQNAGELEVIGQSVCWVQSSGII